MGTRQDVIVVGGGPAGLATAIALGRNDIPVTVLDRQKIPADKVCGEGVMPPGLKFLKEIGALPLISSTDSASFFGIRYLTESGTRAEAEFEAGPGRGIRRTALSSALREVAGQFPSVKIVEEVRVSGIDQGAVVRCENGDQFEARLVVGADGLRSKVRQWAKLNGPNSSKKRFGIRRHFRIAPWSRFVEVYSGPHMEAYVTPCGSEQIGIAILWEPSRFPVPKKGKGTDLFDALLGEFPLLREQLGENPISLGPARSLGPFAQKTIRRTGDGIALLGDASGYLDPCTGEGLTLAFKQALALEKCVVPALQTKSADCLSIADLTGYELAWKKIMRPYFLCTHAMMFCQDRRELFEFLARRVCNRPDVLRHLLSFNMGKAPLFPGLKRTAGWIVPSPPTRRQAI